MYYFELSVDLETAESFCSSHISSGLLFKGRELSISRNKKGENNAHAP